MEKHTAGVLTGGWIRCHSLHRRAEEEEFQWQGGRGEEAEERKRGQRERPAYGIRTKLELHMKNPVCRF